MHARELNTIAASLASVGHTLITQEVRAVGDSAHGYWLANRFRCDAWHQRISQHRSAIERCGTSRRARLWLEVLPTLEEILVSEPLTRVIAYISGLLDERDADGDWAALSHSVLANHVEARHRCLNLMVFGYGFPVEKAVKLNRLRRLLEFFNDQLLGALPPRKQLDSYVFELKMVQCQQQQMRRYPATAGLGCVRLQPLVSSLDQSLIVDFGGIAANPRLNYSIAEAALAMLPAATFDSFGVPRSRLHSMVISASNDGSIHTGDVEHPLAAPLDMLTAPRRIPTEKSRRRR